MFPLFSSFSKKILVYPHLIGQHDMSGYAGPLQVVAGVSQGGPCTVHKHGLCLVLLHIFFSFLCVPHLSAVSPHCNPVAAKEVSSECCFGIRTAQDLSPGGSSLRMTLKM